MVNEYLKPKLAEEIADLERRGFRKDLGKWRFYIDISNILSEYDKDNNLNDVKDKMVSLLSEKKNDISLFAGEENSKKFELIVEQFSDIKKPSKKNLDDVFEKLYDWADDNDTWIESFKED